MNVFTYFDAGHINTNLNELYLIKIDLDNRVTSKLVLRKESILVWTGRSVDLG